MEGARGRDDGELKLKILPSDTLHTVEMYLCYFDESGDSGYGKGTSGTFALSALVIHDDDWLDALNQTIGFRRWLKNEFGIAPRAELKAQWIIHGKKYFRDLNMSFETRLKVYKSAMRFQRKAGVFRCFSVLIRKTEIYDRSADPRDWAWQFALERLERIGTSTGENLHVLPDEGHGYFIRRKIRRMRRHNVVQGRYGGTLNREVENIIGDCSPRDSARSYFIQLADLNAYATYRKVYAGKNLDGSYWNELGEARIEDVNQLAGGPPGIKVWPR